MCWLGGIDLKIQLIQLTAHSRALDGSSLEWLSLPPVDGQASVEEESKRCKLCSDGQPVCGPLLKA